MPAGRYQQLATKQDDEETIERTPNSRFSSSWIQKGLLSFSLILVYFTLSIGLTFYQKWLLKKFKYPLTVVMYHLLVKWILSNIVRGVIYLCTCTPQLVLPCATYVREVAPTGLAAGIDVGFSNWALKLVNMSLYTMTKSTTIIFILFFAIMHNLEKKSWSLVIIVVMISSGLVMFIYKATEFSLLGFYFLILASFAGGLRWTFAQVLVQRAKLGLNNPVDMVFHVQPWMFLALMPFTVFYEGFGSYYYLMGLDQAELVPEILKITVGATIAFAMELSEFLVVTYTSSLTLSVAGIFKEMFILTVAILINGDQLSTINAIGLAVCLVGITAHTVHKIKLLRDTEMNRLKKMNQDSDCEDVTQLKETNNSVKFKNTKLVSKLISEQNTPLLDEERFMQGLDNSETDYQSDSDSNRVILDVSQRRSMTR